VPAERVAALRQAFVQALNDKTLARKPIRCSFDVDPMSGDELQKLVADLYAHRRRIWSSGRGRH
jgi:tripartite-type tricarboxylate transporter receptor subunit TctC